MQSIDWKYRKMLSFAHFGWKLFLLLLCLLLVNLTIGAIFRFVCMYKTALMIREKKWICAKLDCIIFYEENKIRHKIKNYQADVLWLDAAEKHKHTGQQKGKNSLEWERKRIKKIKAIKFVAFHSDLQGRPYRRKCAHAQNRKLQ